VYDFYGQGSSYEELHAMNQQNEHKWSRYVDDTSFRFNVTAYYHKIPQKRQHQVIESFSYMDFRGKIDMKNPDVVMTVYEECMSVLPFFDLECPIPKDDDTEGVTKKKHEGDGEFRQVYFGRLVSLPVQPLSIESNLHR